MSVLSSLTSQERMTLVVIVFLGTVLDRACT
jgi:hypothetical protein